MNGQPEKPIHLSQAGIRENQQAGSLADLSVPELVALFATEEALVQRAPEGYYPSKAECLEVIEQFGEIIDAV